VLTAHCFSVIHNFAFCSLYCYFISLVKGDIPYVVCYSSVGSVFAYGASNVGLIPICVSFFLFTISVMVLEAMIRWFNTFYYTWLSSDMPHLKQVGRCVIS
jgi:hypothetical protein